MRRRQQQQRKAALFEALEGRTHFSATISGLVHNDVNGDGFLNEFSATPATRVYLDTNQNGRRDSGEVSVVTDANGQYEFNDVPGGSYVVRFDLPAGWAPSNHTALVGKPVIFTEGATKVGVTDALIRYAKAPWSTVGQNPQHTGISPFPGLPFQQVQAVADLGADNAGNGVTYGSPLFTKYGTIIVPSLSNGRFTINAFFHQPGGESRLLWHYTSTYVAPPTGASMAVFQPVLSPDGKLYFPEAAGTIGVIESPDPNRFRPFGATIETRAVKKGMFFYPRKDFVENPSFYRKSLFVNTPLTIDNQGNLYFGVYSKVETATVRSVLAKISANGRGSQVSAAVVTGRAPVLSNDGQYVYVMTQKNNTATISRFGTARLNAAGSAVLLDPSNQKKITLTNTAVAAPTVGPDGDVFVPVPARSDGPNAGNGWVLHFSADLKSTKLAGGFNSDTTISIVPASMVPDYHGKSSYLILSAVGEYDLAPDTVALLDPKIGEVNKEINGVKAMKVVRSMPGVANRFTSAAVDPTGGMIYFVGYTKTVATEQDPEGAPYIALFGWSVRHPNTIPQIAFLSTPENRDVAPVTIGPNGEVFAITNGILYAAF